MVCLFQVYAEKLHIEMDDIGEGIVELVYQHSIKKLVIGAAADKHYSEYWLITLNNIFDLLDDICCYV